MTPQPYGQVSFLDKLTILVTFLGFPVTVIFRLLLSPFRAYEKHKSWRRVAGDGVFRVLSSSFRVNQLQYITGTSRDVYIAWAKANKRPILIDDLDDQASLMWFTDKRTSGGVYQLPMQAHAPAFWTSMLGKVKAELGEDYGFVGLSYSLYPSTPFPAQLHQASQGLSRLLSLGIKPEDIHLAGESAGGGLSLQVLSHILHPYDGVPKLSFTHPLGGAFLMSPWVCLTTEAESYTSNSDSDILPKKTWAYLGNGILANLPEAGKPYVEACKAPDDWWIGIDEMVKKITIYTGGSECLRDDDISLSSTLEKHHNQVTLFVHENGIHIDPYLTHLVREKDSTEIVDMVLGHFRS